MARNVTEHERASLVIENNILETLRLIRGLFGRSQTKRPTPSCQQGKPSDHGLTRSNAPWTNTF